jgi:hypothetical protein
MIEIDISTGAYPNSILRIDDCDAHLVVPFKWTPCCGDPVVYAQRQPAGEHKLVYLHRVILEARPGETVDHIDRDGLNNTRSNLRIVSLSTNAWNRRTWGRSRFKGVCKDRGLWRACIKTDGKTKHLGRFVTEDAAAQAFDEAAIRQGRDHTGLNFPNLALERERG